MHVASAKVPQSPMWKWLANMTKATSRSRWLKTLAGLFILFALAVLATGLFIEDWRRPTRERWAQVVTGKSEHDVRLRLGKPYKVYDKATAPASYYEPGYRHKEREISHRVLIYMGNDLILYVWIDEQGNVEDSFIGPS